MAGCSSVDDLKVVAAKARKDMQDIGAWESNSSKLVAMYERYKDAMQYIDADIDEISEEEFEPEKELEPEVEFESEEFEEIKE